MKSDSDPSKTSAQRSKKSSGNLARLGPEMRRLLKENAKYPKARPDYQPPKPKKK
jgi:hypothetical protein